MKISSVLGLLLVGSAITLSAGAIILMLENLVPEILVELTAVAVAVILPLSFLVGRRRNIVAINISTGLGIVAPLVSLATPAHLAVLASFGQNTVLSILGGLQFLGFYLFPLAFVIIRLAFRNKIAAESSSQTQNTMHAEKTHSIAAASREKNGM
jgi:hypothetical protein